MATARRSRARRVVTAFAAIAAFGLVGAAMLATDWASSRPQPTEAGQRTAPPTLDLIASPTAGTSAASTPPPPSATETSAELGGYFTTAGDLRERASLAMAGVEPYRTAVDQLVATADRALSQEPRPRNPITHRRGRFMEDAQRAYTLAIAAVVADNGKYASAAATTLKAWVNATDSTRDACPKAGGSDCATSLLLSRNAPAFVFAADLLEQYGALPAGDRARFEEWLRDVILPAASERTNNWGDAGTFMRLVVSDYVGDRVTFAEALDDWRSSMDLVTGEGEIPEETRRGKLGLLYTQGAISYKAASAFVAERRGVDLWTYEGERGGSLRSAVDLFLRYWAEPEAWPWHDRPQDIPTIDPVWELVFQEWPDPRIAELLDEHRPLGSTNPSAIIWTTVTNGEELAGAEGASTPDGPEAALPGGLRRAHLP